MKDKETQVGNGKRSVNTSGMRSDPICHENEEEALKVHCVFGELAVFHDSNRRMCNECIRGLGRNMAGYQGNSYQFEFPNEIMNLDFI